MGDKKIAPQLSLFENETCTQCGDPVKNNVICCDKCEDKWREKYLKEKKD
jgi:hypothetical protein